MSTRLFLALMLLAGCAESDDGGASDGGTSDGGSGDGGASDGGASDGGASDGGSGDGGSGDGGAPPDLVTLSFTGEVVTVSGTPFGLDDGVRTMPVAGTFTYDLAVADTLPDDPARAVYDHRGSGAFLLEVEGLRVEGSGSPLTEVQDFGDTDVWRFVDGPQLGDETPRVLVVDGVADPEAELWVSLSFTAAWSGDAQPDPFPAFARHAVPHTFSLEDPGGTLLIQLDSLAQDPD